MEQKDYIINQLAIAKAQMEVNFHELKYQYDLVVAELEELKKKAGDE